MNNKWTALLKSRKFWAAIVGVLLVIVRNIAPNFPLSDTEVTNLVYLIVAFILGTGLEDSATA